MYLIHEHRKGHNADYKKVWGDRFDTLEEAVNFVDANGSSDYDYSYSYWPTEYLFITEDSYVYKVTLFNNQSDDHAVYKIKRPSLAGLHKLVDSYSDIPVEDGLTGAIGLLLLMKEDFLDTYGIMLDMDHMHDYDRVPYLKKVIEEHVPDTVIVKKEKG